MLKFKVLALMCLGLLVSCGFSESGGSAPEAASLKTVAAAAMGTHLAVNPDELDFGRQSVGTGSPAMLVMLANNGSSPITISGLSIGPGEPFNILSSPPTPFQLPPGVSMEIPVDFRPTFEGTAWGNLTLNSNDPTMPIAKVVLGGIGVKPTLSLSPTSLAFGEQRVGTSSTRLVTVTNAGSGNLEISNLSIGSGQPFTVSPNTAFTVAPGASMDVAVAFSPTTEGDFAGTLTLTTNDPDSPSATILLSGRAVKPSLMASPTSLDFGQQRVGTSSTRQVTVTNAGSGPITVMSLSISGSLDFTLVTAPSTPYTLAANMSMDVAVAFSPTTEAAFSGTLTVTTDDPGLSTTVALSGTGVKPSLAVSPTALDFGQQRVGTTSAAQTVTVSNAGTGPLVVHNLTTSGAPFVLVSPPTVPFTLAEGALMNLMVRFSPTAEGQHTGALTISSDDLATPNATVSLAGSGVKPSLAVSPTQLDFGEQQVGTTSVARTVTVSNTGTGPLTITSSTIGTGQPFAVSRSESFTLMAGGTMDLQVTFSPTIEGAVMGTLTFTTDDPDRPTLTVPLAGTGVRPVLAVSATSLDFGSLKVGTSRSLTVTVANTGTGTLNVQAPSLTSGTPFSVTPSVAFSLHQGQSLALTVTFSPATSGASNATLTLVSNTANSPAVVNLTGSGGSPQLALSISTHFFGDVRVGSTSTSAPITVRNTGTAEATVQSLTATGPFEVILSTSLPMTVPPNGSFTFEAVFKPVVEGDATGSVSVSHDAGPALTVALSGRGTLAAVSTSVTSLAFGNQRVLLTSAAQSVTLTNTGSGPVEMTELTFSNSTFALSSSPALPLVLAPNEQKVLSVTFTPSTLGAVEGKLYIVSNAHTPTSPLALTGMGVDGQLSLTPNTVSFSGVEVGSTGAQQSVVLSNAGSHPLTVTSVGQPTETSFSISGLAQGLVIAPGGSAPFTVTFIPTRRGYVSGTVALQTDSVLNPTTQLSVSGTGLAPAVELQPTDLLFGKTHVGGSTSLNLTIKNVGEKDLHVANIDFADDGTGTALDYSVGGEVAFPLVVTPGQSTLVPLKFTPQAVGLRKARARVYTNDRTAEANLQGEGTSGNLTLSLSSLDFGNERVGRASAPRTLRLTNQGTGPLILTSMMLDGADATSFGLTHPVMPITLQPEVFLEVSVTFTPREERQFFAQLVVQSNDPGTPSVTVPLSGAGVSPQLQLSASSLDFGQQLLNHASSPRTVRVINNSGFPATLLSMGVEGAGDLRFSLSQLTLPLTLAPGQEQEVAVRFTPTDDTEVSAVLKLFIQGLPAPLEVALRGKGIPEVLSIQPSPLDFGTVRVGDSKRERPLTLTNLSSEPIVLAAPEQTYSTGQPFTFDGASLAGHTLEPGMSVTLPVGYQPVAESQSETTLFFGTTTPPRPLSVEVSLEGQALRHLLSANATSLDFGQVAVGSTAEPQEVTVTNHASQPQRVVVMLKNLQATPFVVQTTALADPLPPGGSATFSVTFKPQTAGAAQNEVQVWLQGDTEPEARIAVTGSAEGPSEEPPAGCACGTTEAGSAGMLALLALLGLGSRRRRA